MRCRGRFVRVWVPNGIGSDDANNDRMQKGSDRDGCTEPSSHVTTAIENSSCVASSISLHVSTQMLTQLAQDVGHDFAVNVRKPEVAPRISVRQPLVIKP